MHDLEKVPALLNLYHQFESKFGLFSVGQKLTGLNGNYKYYAV